MNDQDRAALSIRTAADLLTTAAALVELGEKADALRHLKAVRDALEEAAEQGDNWANVAASIDAALSPTLAAGLEIGAAAFNDWQAKRDVQELKAETWQAFEREQEAQARARAEGMN